MAHPLELPELLLRIASYLPVFIPDPLGRYAFNPHDLISCLKVNRIWNLSISPLLWTMYDSYEASRLKIPSRLLEARSHHFRYIRLSKCRSQFAFHSFQVQELEALPIDKSSNALDLIRANPQLRALSWYLPSKDRSPNGQEDAQSALETLSRLERLKLSKWMHLTDTRLVQCFNNNPDLKELTLSSFRGFDQIDGCRSLNRLIHLTLDSELQNNRGLVQLIRFCPNLEHIALRSNADPCVPELGKALRKSCPRLISVKFVQDQNHSRVFLGPLDYQALIQATPRLLHCEIVTDELTSEIFLMVLFNHSTWLQTVCFRMYGRSSEVFSMANQLLGSCYHLTTLELLNEDSWWIPENCMDLFKQKWACGQLESIRLVGVESPLLLDNMDEMDWDGETIDPCTVDTSPSHLEIAARHGWVASEVWRPRNEYLSPDAHSALVGAFLERAAAFPRLCEITLNQYHYTRDLSQT
ncbi:hypothetical protein BGZ74_001337 [Mortierella antarctica]|nr:hypothetical protein BGZ74_001337 [Mortierella antarctica]